MIKNLEADISAALVGAVEAVAEANGIVTVDEGDFMRMFAPHFGSVMPAVLVALEPGEPYHLRMNQLEVEYHFRLRVLRQQTDDAESPYRLTMNLAGAVWRALAVTDDSNPLIPAWARADSLQPSNGCQFVKVEITNPTLQNNENQFLNQPEYRANCAWIDVHVTARSVPYTPS